MPVTRKVGPSPLERIDQFIIEQKTRREAFWSKRDADKAPGSIATSGKKAHGAKALQRKGKGNVDSKLWNPVNCVEHEAHAIRAVQARTDAIQRLLQCCERVDSHLATRGGFVCNSDPVLKMFFRLVGNVRVKTIDAVECVSSWERNVGRGRPFVHNGIPYLPALGEELRSLDAFEFVRVRVRRESCAEDPFLCDVTPLGVPIEPTSAFELRQGGRVNQAALRLRMAMRTVEPVIAALHHSSAAPAPAHKSRLALLSPTGRKSQAQKPPDTRIPGRSKQAETATQTSLTPPQDGPDDQQPHVQIIEPGALLRPSQSRLSGPPESVRAGPNSGLRSAPSRLSIEASGTSADQGAAVLPGHNVTAKGGGAAEAPKDAAASEVGQEETCRAAPAVVVANGDAASGSDSPVSPAGQDLDARPGIEALPDDPQAQAGECTEDRALSSETILPMPPRSTPECTAPATAASASASGCVQLAAAASERVALSMGLREHVCVTLCVPPHTPPATGRDAAAAHVQGDSPVADGVASEGPRVRLERGPSSQGRVTLGLAVVQRVAVEVAVRRHVDVTLRTTAGGGTGLVKANIGTGCERVRVEFVAQSIAGCSHVGAGHDTWGQCGPRSSGDSTDGGAAASASSGDVAGGRSHELSHACSLDAAVDEVVEEMIEFVAASLCPRSQAAGSAAGDEGGRGHLLARGASGVAAARAARPQGAAPRGSARQGVGLAAAAEYVQVLLFVEAARLQGAVGTPAERCAGVGDGACAVLAEPGPAPGTDSPRGEACEAGAQRESADCSPGEGHRSGCSVAATEPHKSCSVGVGGDTGGVTVMQDVTGDDDAVDGGRSDASAEEPVEKVGGDEGPHDARLSATSVVVDEVVQELLQDAIVEGYGAAGDSSDAG